MNQRHYKLVFSKIRGMLVAVSEAASSHNDGARGETTATPPRTHGFGHTVKQSFAALLMAFQALSPMLANAQIANDPNQAGSKPIVVAAGNGTPVINIVAPNSQGVSLNQFNQYNVGTAGVVLNNSGGMNQTQLAGYIQGNPMLGNASASTIINQITGANGSNINGFHEIAGNRANLVIANPNGISVNGGGFINAANVTLTTGTPQLNNGALSGFNVTQGTIAVNGEGLNATNVDKLTLISRAAQLNAGIWAKQADVILGANQVTADNSGTAGAITTQQGTGTAPQFALDVSSMGSMYAGQMRIIGTEAGLGVNNGGELVTDAGDLTLDAQGQLSNTGKIQGANDTTIKAASVDNAGHIGAINNLSLTSTQGVTNSGKVLAGSVQLDATDVNNSGTIIQTGDQAFTLTAKQLNNSGSIGIAEDTSNPPVVDPTTGQATSTNTEAPPTDTGSTINPDTSTAPITTNPVVLKAGHINANNVLTNSGTLTASGALTVNASDAVSNSGAIRTAVPLVIKTGTLTNTSTSSIKSQSTADITASTVVHNQGSLQAQTLTVTAPIIDNNQGNLTGEQVLNLNASGQITNVSGSIAGKILLLNTPQLDNTHGSISTNSDLTLNNAHLDNSTGSISAKNLTLNNQNLTNTDGQLLAAENLTSTADTIVNSNGSMAAGTGLTVNASTSINNDKGVLQGQTTRITTASLINTNNLDTGGVIGQNTLNIITTGKLNNQGGLIAGNTSAVSAANMDNTQGSIQAAKTLTINTGRLTNTQGNVSSLGDLTLTSSDVINHNGNVATAANLTFHTNQLDNTTGTVIASQNAQIQSTQLTNSDGGLIQANNLNIHADNLSNNASGSTGGIVATKALDLIVTGNISNVQGYIGGTTATLQAANLNNSQGQIAGSRGLNITADTLNNTSGSLGSAGNVPLSTASVNNSSGNISSSKGNINLKTKTLINDSGQIIANASTALAAKTISNNKGLIQGNNLSIATGTLANINSGNTGGLIGIKTLNIKTTAALNNQAGYLAGQHVVVQAARIDNSSKGSITSTDTLSLNSTNALNNATGSITANGATQITANGVTNDAGTISSLGDLSLQTGALSNAQGIIIGNQNTTLSATTVNNTKGLIQGNKLTINASSIDNSNTSTSGGLIATNALKVTTTGDITNTNGYMGGTTATINGANVNNGTGKMVATDLTMGTNTINNVSGQISVSGNANITSGSLNNQDGLVYASKEAILNITSIDNSNTIQDLSVTQTNPKGIQAQSITINGDTLNNSSGQIIGGNVSTTSATSLNNQGGQILGGNLSVSAPSLNNISGKLLADNALDLTTQNYTNQGQVQGNHLTELHLKGDFVNQGTLSSGGSLSVDTDGSITNSTGSTLSAVDTLSLSGNNINNQTNATIVANHTLLKASDTIINDGTIDGALTELRAKAIINNSKIYGGTFDGKGGVLIGADTLTNNTNAVIASRAGMNIGAGRITNQPGGLIQTQGDLSVGRTLGTAAEDYAVSGIADQVDNNSATIEVGGNVTQWNVAETSNKNTQFATGAGIPVKKDSGYYLVDGQEYDTSTAKIFFPPAVGGGVSKCVSHSTTMIAEGQDPLSFLNQDGGSSHFYVLLPSTNYPLDVFGYVGEKLNKPNQQKIDILNNTSISSNYGGDVLPVLALRDDLKALGISTDTSFGYQNYSEGELNPLNRNFEYIHQAYYPSRTYTYSETVRTGDGNDSTTVSKPFTESFTYQFNDPIWSVFGVTPPVSNIPLSLPVMPTPPTTLGNLPLNCGKTPTVSQCVTYLNNMNTYQQNKAVYDTWIKTNLPLYIQLNVKINEYNKDLKTRTRYSWQMFTGVTETTTPVVISSSPAKIIVGGNMALSGHITNDKSQIIVGGSLTGNANGITNDNTGATAEQTISNVGNRTDTSTYRPNSTHYFRSTNSLAINETLPTQTINLSVAETRTNASAQAVANAAGNTANNSSSVTVAGQGTVDTSAANGGNANASTINNGSKPSDNSNINGQTAHPDGSPVTTLPTTDGKGIRTVAFNGILPTNALFTTSTDTALDYLIVTDPQFTNKQRFLSSDYMLGQFNVDTKWQRLGDGYYEQKLINDQIITATGQRFIGDYSANEDQYKALMNNGIAAGKAFGLSIGTALTAEQMGKLTTDIVWMVEETVTLPDGSKRRVLVPKVYLALNALDLKGDGTIIAAKNNFLTVKNDVNNNGGTIAAFNTMNMSAHTINNIGGTIGGNRESDITVHTTEDFNNIGGKVRGGNVILDIGRDFNNITTTRTSSTGDMSNPLQRGYASTRTTIDQVASIQALDGDRTKTYTDEDGKEQTYIQKALTIKTGGDANFQGAAVSSEGSTLVDSTNINITTVDTGFAENATYSWTNKNKRRTERSDTLEVGSDFSSTGNTTLIAKNNIHIRGSNAVADGDMTMLGNTIDIESGRATHDSYDETYTKKKGFLSSKTNHSVNSDHADVSIGSTIIGNTTTLISDKDTNIKGSTVFGTEGVDIASINGNVNIGASEDHFNETHYNKTTKSGFGALGGFSFGKMSNEQGMAGDKVGHTGSTVGSLNGNVNIQATKGTLSVSGSDVNTLNGDVNMLANKVAITDVQNTATEDSYSKFKSTGLSVSVSSPIIDAVQSAETIADQAGKAEGGTQLGAVAVSGGLAGYNAYRDLKAVGNNIVDLGASPSAGKLLGALGSVSISLGTQKSESKNHNEASNSQGSSITANNGSVNVTAMGLGKADDSKTNMDQGSDILIQGSTVAGQTGTHFKADDDIIAKAGESTQSTQSSNKSSGGSIGVSIGGSGISANIGINMGKGKANGEGTTHTAAVIGSANSQTTFESGDDASFLGAQIMGKGVRGQVGGDLTVVTTQDKSRYDAKQTNASAGVSIPIGAGAFGVSGSFSNDRTKANTQTTNEVSGVFAGTDGFKLNVQGQTALTGAVIASTAVPVKNSLTTGSLVTEDLTNTSDYKASSLGASASWSGKETVNETVTDAQGHQVETGQVIPKEVPDGHGGTKQAQAGYNGYNAGSPTAMNAQDAESSITRSGISEGTVIIHNEAAQHAATGQTGADTIAGLNRNVSADNNQATGVDNLYQRDSDKITNGFEITKTLGQNVTTFMGYMAKDLDDKGSQPAIGADGQQLTVDVKDKDGNVIGQKLATISEAVAAGKTPTGDVAHSYISQNNAFGNGGYGSILLTGLVGAASGNVTGSGSALLKNTAINVIRGYSATAIKGFADGFLDAKGQPTAESEWVRGALHAIAGCAGASATGGDCASAAAGSAATVALNSLIGADTSQMTAGQKQAYSNLMGTLIAGVTAGVGGDAAAANLASKIEVENNQLAEVKRAVDAKIAAEVACKGNAYFEACVNSKLTQKLAAYLKEEQKKHLAPVAHVVFDAPVKQTRFDDIAPSSGYASANNAPTIQPNSSGCVTAECVADVAASRDTSAVELADRASTASTWSGRVGATATAAASVPGIHQPLAGGVALGANVASVGFTAIEHIARPNGGKLLTDVVGTGVGLATEHIPIAGPALAPLTNEAIEAAKNTSTATNTQNSINDWWNGLTK